MGPSFAVQLLQEADELGMQVRVWRGRGETRLSTCSYAVLCRIVVCLKAGFQQSCGVQQARHSLACI